MKERQMKGNLLLLLAAAIWGCAFVAQSEGAEKVGPFTFLALRSYLGAIVLLPVIAVMDARKKKKQKKEQIQTRGRKLWIAGISCGTILCIASALQQKAMETADSGKAGFITALYILIVPVLGLFLRRKVSLRIWGCIAVALVGLYLLSLDGAFTFSTDDIALLLCAFCFSIHIMVVDHFAPSLDGVRLSCIQFLVCALISTVFMLLVEMPSIQDIYGALIPIAYAGVFSSGIAYTLQIVGQQHTKPAVASLIMSLESGFALLAGILLLRQIPSQNEAIGCFLMFAAIIVCQLPGRKKNSKF